MHKFKFGGIDKDDIYLDETILRMCQTHRRMFVQVAGQLIKEGKNEKALKALDYCQQVIPSKNVPHDFVMSGSKEMADDYIELGEYAKAATILEEMANRAIEYITWYLSMDNERLALSYESCVRNFYILDDLNKSFDKIVQKEQGQPEGEMKASTERAEHYAQKFAELYDMFNMRIGRK